MLTTCGLTEGFTQLEAVGRLACLFSVGFLCLVASIVTLLWLKLFHLDLLTDDCVESLWSQVWVQC